MTTQGRNHGLAQLLAIKELRRLLPQLALGTLLFWGQATHAQTPSLDVNLSGQQTNSTIPPIPASATAIYVDPNNGSDTAGNGSQSSPFKTITRATGVASAGMVIQLLKGNYTADSGELFPIRLKAGQILRGDEASLGEGYVIVGGGTYISPTLARQSVAILADTGSEVRGITLRNEGRRGYALWLESTAPKVYNNSFVGSVHDGIFLTGASDPWIEGNRFYKNGANGISILGTSAPTVVNNLFQETGFGITIDQKSTPQIRSNRILQNRAGVVIGGQSQPKLRGNLISKNLEAGVVAITQSQPDLGTAQEGGSNVFQENGQFDINNSTKGGPITAQGNQLSGKIKGDVNTSGQATVQTNSVNAPAAVAPGSVPLPQAPVVALPPSKPNPGVVAPVLPSSADPVKVTKGSLPPPPAPKSLPPAQTSPMVISSKPVISKPVIAATVAPAKPAAPVVAMQPIPSFNPPVPAAPTQPKAVPADPVTVTTQPKAVTTQPKTVAAKPVAVAAPMPKSIPPKPIQPNNTIVAVNNSLTIQPKSTPAIPPKPVQINPVPNPAQPISAQPQPFILKPASAAPIASALPPVAAPPAATSSVATQPNPLAPPTTGGGGFQPVPFTPAPAAQPVAASPATPKPKLDITTLLPVNRKSQPISPINPPASATVAAANASSAGTRFRVLVNPKGDSDLARLRQLVPDASETSFNGRSIFQAGLYDSRTKAQSVLDKLLDAGFEAVAELVTQ